MVFRRLLGAALPLTLLACGGTAQVPTAAPTVALAPAQAPVEAPLTTGTEATVTPDLSVRALAPDLWLHTSWRDLPDLGRFPSNGLVLLGATEAMLIDTAWGEAPTEALLQYIQDTTGRAVTHVLATHSHDDRVGGVVPARRRGARIHTLQATAALMVAEGRPAPDDTFEQAWTFDFQGIAVEAFFPGAAHAPDNVAVWLPRWAVLAGSCMVRAERAGVGNLADANLATWEAAIHQIERRVPAPRVVVPGHGALGDVGLLTHTIAVVRAALANHTAQ